MAIYKLSCHCNSVEIELNLKKDLEEITRCNCSLCKRRGSIMAAVKLNDLKIIKGKEKLSLYKFGRKQHAEHFFLFYLWNLYPSPILYKARKLRI